MDNFVKMITDFVNRLKLLICLSLYTWAILGWPLCATLFLIYLICSPILWPFGLLYCGWFIYDRQTPKRGSRPAKWARNLPIWKVVADYFAIKTVKTAELPADRNYVFAAHPHGVLATSSGLMFGTNATEFGKLFPDIHVNVATIPVNFWFPFRREFLTTLGVITSDAESLSHVLSRPPSGNAVGIVPGGVAEMVESRPGEHKLVLANRKGFVKLAIKHGADLVPVYHFGEDEVFINLPNPEGGWIRAYQKLMKRLKISAFPLAYGRSALSIVLPEKWAIKLPNILRYGVLPFQKSIVSVVGAPIRVEKCANPSQQQIDAVHAEYCAQLRALFEKHKCELGGLPESAKLEFI